MERMLQLERLRRFAFHQSAAQPGRHTLCIYLKAPTSVLTCWLLFSATVSSGEDVWTSRNNDARTGANVNETLLTTSNVNPRQFGQLFSYRVEGNIFGQPLVVGNVRTAAGLRNIVYVVTSDNIVYALDADSNARNGGLIWRRSFVTGRPFAMPYEDDLLIFGGVTPILANDPVHSVSRLTLFQGNLGIVGTPVIDRGRGTMYVVARTKEGSNYVQALHALDVATGEERRGSPRNIARAPITGDGSTLSFAAIQNQRAGLALVNNRVVIAWGGGPLEGSHAIVGQGSGSELQLAAAYQGYVMTYDADSLDANALGSTACFTTGSKGKSGAGIWQSGRAPVVDADGYIYYFTGNALGQIATAVNQCNQQGGFLPDPDPGLENSLIKLDVRTGVSLKDVTAPRSDRDALNRCDMDLGGSGPMLIPGTSAMVGGGKQGFLHVFDKQGNGYAEISSVQVYDGPKESYTDPPECAKDPKDPKCVCTRHGDHHVMGGPVYWESASRGPLVYVSAETDAIKAFRLSRSPWKLSRDCGAPPAQCRTPRTIYAHPAAILSLSARGNQRGTGILWAAHADRQSLPANHDDVFYRKVAGVLRAYDAEDLSHELWNSKMCPGDALGDFAKFTPPTIANGKVYMATFSGKLVVYGLLQDRRPCNG
jgi:outer membrane protein assembly factor BamB